MKKILTIFSILMLHFATANAQVTFSSIPINAEVGSTVCVDINVTNFTNILSFQLNVNWDTDVLEYQSVNTVDGLPGLAGAFGLSQTSVGNLINGWTAPDNDPYTFGTGSGTIYQVCFNVIGAIDDTSVISFTNNQPSNMNVYQVNGGVEENVFDTVVFNEGTLTVVASIQPLPFETAISTENVDMGANVCVDVTIANFDDMTNMNYTISWDASSLTYTGFNVGTLGLVGFGNANFETTNTASGNLSIVWASGTPASVGNGVLFQVCFDAIGAGGTSPSVSFTSDVTTVDVQNVEGSTDLNGTNGVINIESVMPADVTFTIEDINVCPEDEIVCVDMTVCSFDIIGNIQFPIHYDETVLSFNSLILPPSPTVLPNITTTDDNFVTNEAGQIDFFWTTTDDLGTTRPCGTVIFTMCFDILSTDNFTLVEVAEDNGNLPIEVTKIVNFIPIELDPVFEAGEISFTGSCGNNVTETITNINCNSECTGIIALATEEASTFAWGAPIAGQVTSTVSNLCAGVYTVMVTETSSGTTETYNYTVLEPMPMGYSISSTEDNTCSYDENGEIHIIPNGGTFPYLISWSNTTMMGPDITGLANGSYTPTFLDDNDCVFVGSPITIGSLSNLEVSLSVVTSPSSLTSTDGVVDAIVTGASGDVTYVWTGYDDTDSQLNNATVGEITVTVTDALGCEATVNITLTVASSEIVIDDIVVNNALSCFGDCDGEIEVMASGGNSDYTYTWDPAISTSAIAEELCAGAYSVTVSDSAGNTVATQEFTLEQPENLSVSFIYTPATTETTADGSVEASVTGGVEDYTYLWSDDNNTTTANLDNVLPGFYTLTVTDANMCEQTEVAELTVGLPEDCFGYRRVITANDDSKNDYFVISCVEFTKDNTLEIFNRWGQRVYDVKNYDNTWDGTSSSGDELVEGGYFFVFAYTDFNDDSGVIKGAINLLRK